VVESAARSAVVVVKPAILATRTKLLRPLDLDDLAVVHRDANFAIAKVVQCAPDELEGVYFARHGFVGRGPWCRTNIRYNGWHVK
jgi:hypothetical protein